MTKAALILSVLALSGIGCNRSRDTTTPALPTANVRLARGVDAASEGWVAAALSATQRATLATRLAASVKRVHVTEGQKVAAGTLLVSLADEDIQSGLKAAEAALASADAQHRRVENLMKTGASMAAEQDMARTQLAQAKAALAQVQASIAYTQIRSPFAGVVQARRVNDGDFVGPGTPLVEIEGQGAFELLGSISEEEAMNLKMGMRLPFETEGRAGEALITGLSSGGDPITHRGTIRARVVRSDGAMRSGTFARIKLPGAVPVKAEAAPSVPLSALVVRGELNGVFVAREGRAELRWLSIGERQGDRVLVRAGLAKGEAVIDTPGGLRDGQPVEVMR